MTLIADIRQGLALLPAKMNSRAARIIMVAINGQENPRRLEQQVGGPARGDYQFERGGGVRGVMTHASSKEHCKSACKARGVPFESEAIYQAIGTDPILAAALARLLLWTDPKPLPLAGDEAGAWALYERVWRPGKPYPGKWAGSYRLAMDID